MAVAAVGQETVIRGKVKSSISNDRISQSSVLLLTTDSVLLAFVRTQKDGSFSIHTTTRDSTLLLLITHPSIDPYIRAVIAGAGPVDLGVLTMLPPVEAMEAVVVTSREIKPHLKGDTLEYNTRNIRLNQNASSEELLRGLPGVTIDPDGNIYVNGQKVDHLLIDGEDFFGTHPGVATKSLTADMIAKVQLFNKKSDQATFTGVNDGGSARTLNLVLKEEKKGSFFGNVAYGAGDQGYYNGGGMIASFKNKRQIALLGLADNTGPASVNSAGLTEGGLMVFGGVTDPMGASAGLGIPEIKATGAHYADTWNNDARHLVGNYQYTNVMTRPSTTSISIQNLVDTTYLQTDKSASVNRENLQNFTGQYNVTFDSLHIARISVGGNTLSGNNQLYKSDTSDFNNTLINSSVESIRSSVNNKDLKGDLFYRITGGKNKDVNLSLGAGVSSFVNNSEGYVYQLARFYNPNGSLSGADTVDQRKSLSNSGTTSEVLAFFTQQLKGVRQLSAHAGYIAATNRNQQFVYAPADGHYNTLIDSLSNDYHLMTNTSTGGLGYDDKIGPIGISVMLDASWSHYHQNDALHSIPFDYRYLNWNPRFLSNTYFNSAQFIHVEYEGVAQQPTANQLQPTVNNNDPLHVTVGNPGLHSGYTHRVLLSFYSTRKTVLVVTLVGHLATEDIGSRTTTDNLGRQITQFINVSGAKGTEFNFALIRSLGRSGLNMSLDAASSYSRSYMYLSDILATNDLVTSKGTASLSKYVPDKWNFRLSMEGVWSYNRSSVNSSDPVKYWTQHHMLDAGYFPLWGIELHSNLDYSWRQKVGPFDTNNTIWNWNAWINKSILKNKMILRWSITNILNQNAGISRTISLNQTSQSMTNVLGRCWLFTATWRFEHKK